MPRITGTKRSTLIISIAIMIAMLAVACEAAAEKPTAEPPTPIPTVAVEDVSDDAGTSSALSVRDALSDPDVLECLSEQLGGSFDASTGAIGPELLGRLDPQELAMLESCGVDVDGALGDVSRAATDLFDPEIRECLAGELGEDFADNLGRGSGLGLTPESLAAFEVCGFEQGTRTERGDGGRFSGGFAGSVFSDPEIRECLAAELGEDFADNLGGGSGFGLTPESLAAFEECGLNFGDTGGAFGGRDGGDGGFGGRLGGGGFGGFLGGDGSFQECMDEELGAGGLAGLRNSVDASGPPPELQAALEKCGGGIAIPVETNGGIGDGAGPLVDPLEEPTATPIPVSDLTIEQLTCLSGALEPADLANAVIATSAGDLSEISDEVLAALQDCGVGV